VQTAVGLEGGGAALVRPYFRTGGRTRPTRMLLVETLVSTTERGRAVTAFRSRDEREICLLCRTSHSVAEVAARRNIPLGVARVLLADLAELGLVAIHTVELTAGNRPSLDLMRRILEGLRSL